MSVSRNLEGSMANAKESGKMYTSLWEESLTLQVESNQFFNVVQRAAYLSLYYWYIVCLQGASADFFFTFLCFQGQWRHTFPQQGLDPRYLKAVLPTFNCQVQSNFRHAVRRWAICCGQQASFTRASNTNVDLKILLFAVESQTSKKLASASQTSANFKQPPLRWVL